MIGLRALSLQVQCFPDQDLHESGSRMPARLGLRDYFVVEGLLEAQEDYGTVTGHLLFLNLLAFNRRFQFIVLGFDSIPRAFISGVVRALVGSLESGFEIGDGFNVQRGE